MFTVRRIRPDEAETLRSVRLRALADAPGDATTTVARTAALTADHWVDAATANSSGGTQATFFAESEEARGTDPDGIVVGMVGCYANRDGIVNLIGLWSAPGHRAVGVADRLLEVVASWARDQGATYLRHWLVERNEFARTFYEGVGFVATGTAMPYEPDPRISQMELLLAL
jgi:GNAT superfamily N-acetyltransferase